MSIPTNCLKRDAVLNAYLQQSSQIGRNTGLTHRSANAAVAAINSGLTHRSTKAAVAAALT